MILYNFSDKKLNRLIPEMGEKRHLGKSKVTGKKVTFLTTNPKLFLETVDGDNFFKFRYIVKLRKDDPYLHSDDRFNRMLEKHIIAFELKCDIPKWYFYDNPIDRFTVAEWDVDLESFVK